MGTSHDAGGCGKLAAVILRSPTVTPEDGKGWFAGPWDSTLPVAVGWADRGAEPATSPRPDDGRSIWWRGARVRLWSRALPFALRPATCWSVEPGEAHTFIDSSADYLHFVVQAPFVRNDKVDLGRALGQSRLSTKKSRKSGALSSESTPGRPRGGG